MSLIEYTTRMTVPGAPPQPIHKTLHPQAAAAALHSAQEAAAAVMLAAYVPHGQLSITQITEVLVTQGQEPPIPADEPPTQHAVTFELSPKTGGKNIVALCYSDFTVAEAQAAMECARNLSLTTTQLIQSGVIVVLPSEAPFAVKCGRVGTVLPKSA
jgi:hypothetical protein